MQVSSDHLLALVLTTTKWRCKWPWFLRKMGSISTSHYFQIQFRFSTCWLFAINLAL